MSACLAAAPHTTPQRRTAALRSLQIKAAPAGQLQSVLSDKDLHCFRPEGAALTGHRQPVCLQESPALLLKPILQHTQSICALTASPTEPASCTGAVCTHCFTLENSSSALECEPNPWLQHRSCGNASRQAVV